MKSWDLYTLVQVHGHLQCALYRNQLLNSHTKLEANPIRKIIDCIDALSGAAIYSLLDSPAAYHQIPMKECDIEETAFIIKFGLYEWVVLLMGLSGAATVYQRLMELVLWNLQWDKCVISLDDVIVFGKTFEESADPI